MFRSFAQQKARDQKLQYVFNAFERPDVAFLVLFANRICGFSPNIWTLANKFRCGFFVDTRVRIAFQS